MKRILPIAVVLTAGLAGCETTTALTSRTLAASNRCDQVSPNVIISNPPVTQYWCKAQSGAPKPLRLDVFVNSSWQGAYYYRCTDSAVPNEVKTSVLCT